MNRISLLALAAALALVPSLAAAEPLTIDVPSFTGIEAATGIKVIASQGDQSVVADSPNAADISELRWAVDDDTLKLWYEWSVGDIFDWSKRNVTVTVSARAIDDLKATSGARIEATGLSDDDIDLEAESGGFISLTNARAEEYDIEATAGASIEVAGVCEEVDIEASAGSTVSARGLTCEDAEISASSGSTIEVFASDKLSAELSSGATAIVLGEPTVDKLETSSGGSVSFEK